MRWLIIFALLFMLAPSSLMAQELYMLGGILRDTVTDHSTYAYNIEYLEGLGENFAVSYTYLNQGHFEGHHRDGAALNFWLRTSLLDRRLSLGAGGGPFYYLDTTNPQDGSLAADKHGWGGIASVAATWYTESHWLFNVRGNWVKAGGSFDTLALLAGIGYQFDRPDTPGMARTSRQEVKTTDNEITVFGGQTTVNLPGDTHSLSTAIEYRRGLWRYIDWTAGFLYEGESGLIHRYGLTSQFWLERAVLDERATLGLGVGGYLAIDHSPDRKNDTRVEVPIIFTMTASYRITPEWLIRGFWTRVITSYDRDSDVFLGGLGYRF